MSTLMQTILIFWIVLSYVMMMTFFAAPWVKERSTDNIWGVRPWLLFVTAPLTIIYVQVMMIYSIFYFIFFYRNDNE